MNAASLADLLLACRVLFGRDLDPSFLGHLQESGLRAAWRLKALQTHPDRTLDRLAKQLSTERFIEARRAYALLRAYVGQRTRHREPAGRAAPADPAPCTPHQPRRRHSSAQRRCDPRPTPHLPRRRLRLGEYLYHSRVILFSTLIEALLWQRRQRDRFCEVGRRWGYLSDDEVHRLFEERRSHERVGATAQRLGLLNAFQVRTVLSFQQSRQEPLGSYFVQHGLLTPLALHRLLNRFERHNAAFSREP